MQVPRLPLVTPAAVTAGANGNTAIWPTGEGRESEEDIELEGVTVSILLKRLPGVIGSVSHLGRKGLTGLWVAITLDLPGLLSRVALQRDRMAHCADLPLAQRMRAAASANSCAATAGDPPLGQAMGRPRARELHRCRMAAMTLNRPTIRRGTSRGLMGRPSRD